MSKAVMISIKPQWVELIASGEKTVEVRKTRPKIDVPFKCYIYCTKPSYEYEDFFVIDAGTENAKYFYGSGKVVGDFVCDEIKSDISVCIIPETEYFCLKTSTERCRKAACLTERELYEYSVGKPLYGWKISELKMYDKPKKLSEFYRYGKYKINGTVQLRHPPQSWGYVEELKE